MPPRKHELYHWDRIWEADIETTFSERAIAGERALEAAFGDVRMYFGLGPPLATDPSQDRSLRILEAMAPGIRGLLWGRQVHGCKVAAISRERDRDLTGVVCVGDYDALMTTEKGVGLMVWTADCVPVLLAGPRVVAAIHSGWRGTAADIVGAVVRRFQEDHGVAADRIRAFLGPAISGARYEVGNEVISALEEIPTDNDEWHRGNHVDLRMFLAARLRRLGVGRASIGVIGPCTASTADLASYRRDGAESGRQWSLIFQGCSGGGPAGEGNLRPRS